VELQTLYLLLFLLVAVSLDLAFRWLAFGRVESIAIDVAIFSLLYSCLKLMAESGEKSHAWGIKAMIGLVLVAGLTLIHKWLKGKLDDRVENTFLGLQNNLSNGQSKDMVQVQHRLVTQAIDLALLKSKPGKRERREKIIEAVQAAHLDPKGVLNEDSFLLEKRLRVLGWLMFVVGGGISIVIPLLKFE
jgi:hypothetical protein